MSELNVDTINEQTASNGVTIDGVLIKDGEVDGVDVSKTGLVLIDSHDFSAATSVTRDNVCLLYTSPSPRDVEESRMPSSA